MQFRLFKGFTPIVSEDENDLALAGSTNSFSAGDFDMLLVKTGSSWWVQRETTVFEPLPFFAAIIALILWFKRKK